MKPALLIAFVSTGLALCGCGGTEQNSNRETSVPDGFGPICEQTGVTCETGQQPPSLLGSYTGEGETLVTSNRLWRVGETGTFSVQVTSQNGDTLSGSIEQTQTVAAQPDPNAKESPAFHLDVAAARVRGDARRFTLYGTDSVEYEGCNLEARAVITGTGSDEAQPATLSGDLILVFTQNIQGAGCTAEQIHDSPGTGAHFKFSVAKTP